MVERWLTGAHARLQALPEAPSAEASPVRCHASFPPTRSDEHAGEESRARRVAAYEEVRRRHLAGAPLLRISRTLKLARATVRKYARAETFPERAVRVPGRSILDPFLQYLEGRHAAGCENALALWREIRAKGFGGTSRQVHRWLQIRRSAPARSTPRRRSNGPGSASSHSPRSPLQRLPHWLVSSKMRKLLASLRWHVASVNWYANKASRTVLSQLRPAPPSNSGWPRRARAACARWRLLRRGWRRRAMPSGPR